MACQPSEQTDKPVVEEEKPENPLPEVEAASPELALVNPLANRYENNPETDGFERSIVLKKVGPDRFGLEILAQSFGGEEICKYQIGAIERTKQVLEGEVKKVAVQFIREEAALHVFPVDSLPRKYPGRLCPGGSINGYYLPMPFIKGILPEGNYLPRPEQWLSDQYLSELNDVPTGPQLDLHYETEIISLADYNGDKRPDYAALLLDQQGQLRLYAMLSNNGTWEASKIADLGKVGEKGSEYVGAGLDSEAAGSEWTEGKTQKLRLKQAGILLKYYEKSSTLYYLEGEEWKSMVISD